jgi:peroxin-5
MLGTCHSEIDNDKKAILCLTRAVDLDPYNLDALLALGTSYVNEMEPQKALETLRSWVTHNPKFQGLSVAPDEYSDGYVVLKE